MTTDVAAMLRDQADEEVRREVDLARQKAEAVRAVTERKVPSPALPGANHNAPPIQRPASPEVAIAKSSAVRNRMVRLATDAIYASIRCAAIPCEFAEETDILSALRAGRYAGDHGRCVPLAPFLDLTIAGRWSKSPCYFGRRSGFHNSLAAPYDAWLNQTYSSQDGELRRGTCDSDLGPFADVVAFSWPVSRGDAACWADAYQRILDDRACAEQVRLIWRDDRSSAAEDWQQFWSPPSPVAHEVQAARAYNAWAKFRQQTAKQRSEDVHERFDHHAAFLYFQADDPPLRPDQLRRIHRLKTRHSLASPIRGTPDDQDPYDGQIPLAALIREPFAAAYSAVINHEVAFLNNPPVKKPPREFHLHLCYGPRYGSVATTHQSIKRSARRQAAGQLADNAPEQEAGSAQATHAATVQGLATLLLEDWRYLLNGLPVQFHVHVTDGRHPPQHRTIQKLGIRWRDEGVGVPPADVVGTLFRRHTRVEMLDDSEREWQMPRSTSGMHWYCGIASSLDLGLSKTSMGYWTTDRWTLPDRINHLIVVDAPIGQARLFQVSPRSEDRNRLLRSQSFNDPPEDDLSFCLLRSACFDLVLGVVESVFA
jgi:hypothetical protein